MSKSLPTNKNIAVKKLECHLSGRQSDLLDLYLQAKGKAIIWVKNRKARIINPDEVIVVES